VVYCTVYCTLERWPAGPLQIFSMTVAGGYPVVSAPECLGTALARPQGADNGSVHRSVTSVATMAAGIEGRWTPHELRHSCIAILSDAGEPLEKIADLVGHADTRMMSTYRHQIRPSVDTAVDVMGKVFGEFTDLR
jgi:hypothetical protein